MYAKGCRHLAASFGGDYKSVITDSGEFGLLFIIVENSKLYLIMPKEIVN
jgi:hypothetical protein